MSKKASYIILLALALLTPALVSFRTLVRQPKAGDGLPPKWGRADLVASEEACYGDRITGIVDAWRDIVEPFHPDAPDLRHPFGSAEPMETIQKGADRRTVLSLKHGEGNAPSGRLYC